MDFVGFNEGKQSRASDTQSLDGATDPLDLGDDEHEPVIPSAQERRGLLHDTREAANAEAGGGGGGGKGSGRGASSGGGGSGSVANQWTKVILYVSIATIVIGVAETCFAVYLSSRAIVVLSVACVALALCALLAATLSAFAIVAVRDLESNPATSFAALSLYVNTGCMLCVTLITLGITVMSLQPDFFKYVQLHWRDGDDDVQLWRHFAGLDLTGAEAEIRWTCHVIGALAILMALCLAAAVWCATHVRPAHAPIFGVQSFLWVHGTIGVLGCVLLAVSIYSLYHEWSLPISQAEGRLLRALGVLSFGMALLGLYRAHALTDEEALAAQRWQYLHSSKSHVGGGSQSHQSISSSSSSRKKTAARARRHSGRDGTGAGVISIPDDGTTGSTGSSSPAPPPVLSGVVASDDPISQLNDGDEPTHTNTAPHTPRAGPHPPVSNAARVWAAIRSYGPVYVHVLTLAGVTIMLLALWIDWVYRSVPEHTHTYLSHRQWLSDDSHMELQHSPEKLALVLHLKLAILAVVAILAAVYVSAGAVLGGCLDRLVRQERALAERQ